MSTTITKDEDKDRLIQEKLRQEEERQRREKAEAQQQRVNEQNAWFFELISVGPGLEKIKQIKKVQKKREVLGKLIKQSEKQDDEQQKATVTATRYQILYEDRRTRSEASLKEIGGYLPAAKSLATTFEKAHQAADDILKKKEGAWEAAHNALPDDSAISAAADNAQKLWDGTESSGRKAAPAVFKSIDTTRQALDSARAMLTIDAIIAFRDSIDLAEAPLHTAPKPGKDDIEAAAKKIGEVERKLDTDVKAAGLAKRRAERLYNEVKAVIEQADSEAQHGDLPGYTERDTANFSRQLSAAQTNIGLRDFVEAETLLDALKLQVEARRDDLASRLTKAKDAWSKQKGELGYMMDRADKLSGNGQLPDSLQFAAKKAGEQLAQLTGITPGADPSFEEAVSRVAAIEKQLKDLEVAAKDVPDFLQQREVANQHILKMQDDAAKAIVGLVNALEKAKGGPLDPTIVIDPLQERLRDIGVRWTQQIGDAINLRELKEQEFAAELSQLLQDIDRTSTTGLDDAVGDIVLAPGRAAYAQAREKAMRVAFDIVDINAVDGAALVNAIEAIDIEVSHAATPQDLDNAIKRLGEVITPAVKNRAGGAGMGIKQYQNMLADKLKPVPGLLGGLKNKVDGIKDGATQTPFRNLLDTYQTEYETLLTLSGSRQRELIERALNDADTLIADVGTATRAIDKPKDKGKPRSFRVAAKQLADYNKRLQAEDVQTYALATATELSERSKALEKGFGNTNFRELDQQIDALGLAVTKVESDAVVAKGNVKLFEPKIAEQKKRLDGEPFKTLAPDFATAAKGRLDAILTNAKFEGGLATGEQDLAKLIVELDGILASPTNAMGQPADLVAAQDKAVEDKRKAELDEARWKAELEVVEKTLKEAKGGDIDSDELASLRSTLSDTKKSVAKSKQFEDGREQLRAIRKRLALLEANPYGLVISARNKLPSVTVRVKVAIRGLGKELSALKSAVGKLPPTDLNDQSRKDVEAQLAAVRGLFNPAAFDKSVPVVANADTETNQRSAAREVALRDVRRMMTYLDTDYRMQALAKTPFNDMMSAALSGLKLSLLDLENNLLISVAK